MVHNVVGQHCQPVAAGAHLIGDVKRKRKEAAFVAAEKIPVQPHLRRMGHTAEAQKKAACAQRLRQIERPLVDHRAHVITYLAAFIDVVVRAWNRHRAAVFQRALRIIHLVQSDERERPYAVERNFCSGRGVFRVKHRFSSIQCSVSAGELEARCRNVRGQS